MNLENIHLTPPSTEHEVSFLQALTEFRNEGLPWWQTAELELAERDFRAFVDVKLADATRPTRAGVCKTHLWAIQAEDFVGRLSIFHDLTEELQRNGGHIGYDTVPRFRGRGVATAMLQNALPIARDLGLPEVLLTCDASNIASIKVIERNGGEVRERRPYDLPGKRYFIVQL